MAETKLESLPHQDNAGWCLDPRRDTARLDPWPKIEIDIDPVSHNKALTALRGFRGETDHSVGRAQSNERVGLN
jgi:hypothetical protein